MQKDIFITKALFTIKRILEKLDITCPKEGTLLILDVIEHMVDHESDKLQEILFIVDNKAEKMQ